MTINKFYECVETGDILGSIFALDTLPDINQKYTELYRDTPLNYAVHNGMSVLVEVLVGKGADLNILDRTNGSCLGMTVQRKDYESFNILLEAGADLNLKGSSKTTPLHHAIQVQETEMVKRLLAAGADPNVQSLSMWTPLHCASADGNVELVEILLEAGGCVHDQTSLGHTPIYLAAEFGSIHLVNLFLELGADPSIKVSVFGRDALQVAKEKGHMDIVNLLSSR